MPTTPRLAIPFPTPLDPADGPADMEAIAERVDVLVGLPHAAGGVNGNGTIWIPGTNNWTVTRSAPGDYTITFNTPTIAAFPIVHVISQAFPGIPFLAAIAANHVEIQTYFEATQALGDTTFMFCAWDMPT